jgi:hypothetical protein
MSSLGVLCRSFGLFDSCYFTSIYLLTITIPLSFMHTLPFRWKRHVLMRESKNYRGDPDRPQQPGGRIPSSNRPRRPTATTTTAQPSPKCPLEATVPAVPPSPPFDTSPSAMPQRTLLELPPEPLPLTARPTPVSPPLNLPLRKAQNSESNPYHGREATAKLHARFISHLFTCSDISPPLHRDMLPPVTPLPPLLEPPPEPLPPPATPAPTCPPSPSSPKPPPPLSLRQLSRPATAHKSNADNPQALNVPDPPPANSSTLQDLGTRKNKKATPSTPAPQDLSTTTTPQAQETVNATTNAAAADIDTTNRLRRRPQHPQRQSPNLKSDAATTTATSRPRMSRRLRSRSLRMNAVSAAWLGVPLKPSRTMTPLERQRVHLESFGEPRNNAQLQQQRYVAQGSQELESSNSGSNLGDTILLRRASLQPRNLHILD